MTATTQRIKWFAVYEDLSLKEFHEPTQEERVYFWIKKIFNGSTYTTSYGNVYERFDYEIYNDDLALDNIKVRNCTCHKVYDSNQKHSYNLGVVFEITDNKGILKLRSFDSAWEERSIIEGVKFMQELAKYDTWEHWETHQKNKDLKNEIESVNSLASKLKADLQNANNTMAEQKKEIEELKKELKEEVKRSAIKQNRLKYRQKYWARR